jgi:hypothetical protein
VRGCPLGLAELAPRRCPILLTRDEYEIDDDPARLDLDVVHGFIGGSCWAERVPRDVVARPVADSLNLGLYRGGNQVGFTRAVAGRATFAWVCDVFVLPATAVAGIAGLYPAIRAARPSPAEALRTI